MVTLPALQRLPDKHRWSITATAAALGLIVLAFTTPILALNAPAAVTSSYEILEPGTWPSKKLPILDHIDIGKQLEKGI